MVGLDRDVNTKALVRILMLEASADDAKAAQRALYQSGLAFEARRAPTREAFVQMLAEFKPDIVIAEHWLAAVDGRSALKLVRSQSPRVPVIILSGTLGDEQTVDLIEAGARDYVLKDRMARLGPAVRRALDDESQSRRRQAAEDALRENLAQTQLLIKAANVGLWNWNLVTNEVFFSAEWKSQLGYADEEIAGRYEEWETRLHPDDLEPALEAVQAFVGGRRGDYNVEFRMRHKDGSWHWILARASLGCDESGKPVRLMGCHIDITKRKHVQIELAQARSKLLAVTRAAGMAEVATTVVHNVANVVNSVDISAGLLIDKFAQSRIPSLSRVVALMQEHEPELATFLTRDPKGKAVLPFLAQLADELGAERDGIRKELEVLRDNIEHIKAMVATQLSYATMAGVSELVNARDLVEDALRLESGALKRHGVELVQEFEDTPSISVHKHQSLQILVNLIRNAKLSCGEAGRADRRLTIRVSHASQMVRVSVTDNGVGIAPENLTRIFEHGFTTRKNGHGFGLHSAALAAREMGGRLLAQSDGLGQGATFTLEWPAVSGNAPAPGPPQ